MPAQSAKPARYADRPNSPSPTRATGSERESRGGRSVQRGTHALLFRPGDPVRESGIYEVVHDREHRSVHEVVMIADDHFPTCDTCADKVRFRMVRNAPYIFSDEDFEEDK